MIQILFFCLSLLRLTSGQAQSEDELFASVGVGSASVRGFSWTYDIENADLDTPNGGIYWVLTDDGVAMTEDDVRLANNPVNPGCSGDDTQQDENIHQERMDCTLVAGNTYRFWVVVDYNHDGTSQVMVTPGGVPIMPQEDRDCDGFWSSCDANCISIYTITQYPTGDGAGCEIGDEEEKTCAPGTDDCPLAGEYDVANPTSNGFDINFTPDATANTAGGQWYWMLTPTGATPTPDEVKNSNGGLCGGSFEINEITEVTETVDCKVQGPQTYDVWVAEDPQGDGTPVMINPLKTVDIPGATPVAHLFAHTATDAGYKLSYDVDNPNPAGTFYFLTQPTGSPSPSAADIMGATSCGGSYATDDSGAMKTVDVACPLTPGDYEVWGVVDSDSAGADSSLANDGVGFLFTFTAPATPEPTSTAEPTIATTGTPGATTSTGTPTTDVPTMAVTSPPVEMSYSLMGIGLYCESDQTEEANPFGLLDVIQLPNVAVQTTAGIVQSDIVLCASQVAANRAINGGCSTLFHTGGPSGVCACTRLGYICDEDESEIGQSIFQLCPTNNCVNAMGVIDLQKTNEYKNQLMLQQQHSHQTESTTDSQPFELFGVPLLYYGLAMLCGVVSGMAVYYIACAPRYNKNNDLTEDFYHIALDTQQE